MGKWIDIVKEWNKRRKKGLKNPTVLWSTGFILTFALTILPSVLVTALDAKNSALLLNQETWITAIPNDYNTICCYYAPKLQYRHPIKKRKKESAVRTLY